MNRRQYLAGGTVVTAVALAGCVGSLTGDGPEFRAAEDPWSQGNEFELSNGNGQSGLVTLPEGTYAQLSTNQDIDIELEIAAKADQPFDVFVLNENEFNRYRDQEEFQYSEDFVARGQREIRFSGTWTDEYLYIVFDNTAFTEAQPDGEITANYTVRQTVG
jgi:hypothetical protein